jgi:hypothetical protein
MPPIDGKSRRQARQAAPVKRAPHAGQASTSASCASKFMRASCRNARKVVAPRAADYHLRMSVAQSAKIYRLVEIDGPAGRRILETCADDRRELLVFAQVQGGSWPGTLSNASVAPREESANARRWRLSSDQGQFDFEAKLVDRVELRPALYAPLHRRFALSTLERLAIRVLIALLRLPGGERLLRRWHARRNG